MMKDIAIFDTMYNQNLQYFKDLFENESFGPLMVVGYNCLNYKIINIKNHVYGYFNKK